MYVCMYASMYASMYVCMYLHTDFNMHALCNQKYVVTDLYHSSSWAISSCDDWIQT